MRAESHIHLIFVILVQTQTPTVAYLFKDCVCTCPAEVPVNTKIAEEFTVDIQSLVDQEDDSSSGDNSSGDSSSGDSSSGDFEYFTSDDVFIRKRTTSASTTMIPITTPTPTTTTVRQPIEGQKGEKGERGDNGLQGPTGETGLKGEDGKDGFPGPNGRKGDKGDQGDVGIRGYTGAQGPQGYRGPQGPRGETGAAGVRGAEGPQGLRGPPGMAGPRGPIGQQGLIGQPGEPGSPGDITDITPGGKIAFLARLENHDGPYKTAQNIVFPQIDFNNGGGYNPSSGSFYVEQHEGIYVFHLHVMAVADHVAWVAIQVNGKPVAYAWASGYETSQEQMGTTMHIQNLKQGDTVNVALKASVDPQNYLYAHYTFFSGFYLGSG